MFVLKLVLYLVILQACVQKASSLRSVTVLSLLTYLLGAHYVDLEIMALFKPR